MPGFPIQMLIQTTSSPAVGDIDGDGDLEMVVGNKYVYAWHHTSQEIVDGDLNPQTWGVLNTEGNEFTAPITLADIDGVPGMEILAGDLYTQKLYAFDGTGANVAGWPQDAEADFRAAPVAGDIDGDGDLEVIAVDSKGVIYAWHGDGSEYRDGDSDPLTIGVFYRTPATGFHYVAPTLVDVDGDGKDEIIQGTRSGTIYCLNEDGSSVAGWPFVLPGEITGHISSGDVDDDGMPEFIARASTSQVYVINHDGTVSSGWPRFLSMNTFFAPSPALGDVNGDGKLEIVIIKYNGATTQLHVIDYQAVNLPGWPMTLAEFTESSPVLVDVNGDGLLDILLGDESRFIYAWDLTGTLLSGFPIATFDAVRATPFIGDVDRDSDVDMLVYSWDKNVYLYDLDGNYNPYMAPWPTLQANAQRTGSHGFAVVSAIENAAFTFRVGRQSVNLMWLVPAAEAFGFYLDRAEVNADMTGEFVRVASGLQVDAAGFIEYDDTGVAEGRTYVYRLTAIDNEEDIFVTDAIYVPVSRAELSQNFPNPFNPTTRIAYWVPEGGERPVRLTIYDVSGAKVKTLVNESKTGGRFEVRWNGQDDRGSRVASGVYFYRLTQPGYSSTKKMVLLK